MVGPCAVCMPLRTNHMTATDAITNASAGQRALGGASDGGRLRESGVAEGGASAGMTGSTIAWATSFCKHRAAKVVLGANGPGLPTWARSRVALAFLRHT